MDTEAMLDEFLARHNVNREVAEARGYACRIVDDRPLVFATLHAFTDEGLAPVGEEVYELDGTHLETRYF